MPSSARRLATLVVACACAWSALTAFAQDVSLTDYRVPTSRALSVLVDARYDYERVDNATLANDGAISLDYSLFYESLPFAYSVAAVAQWSRSWTGSDYLTSYGATSAGRIKKFVWDRRDLFGSVRVGGEYDKGFDQPASSVTVGVGWGRFINATSLRKARRIDTFFVKEGVASARLPKETMLEIAEVIERQREYQQNYGAATYGKFWFDDIERIVQESGRLNRESIGAGGILRMEEVLFRENIGSRFFGYDITAGVRYALTVSEDGATLPSPAADLSIRYARPLSWESQLDMQGTITTPLENERFVSDFHVAAAAGYLYELTNRVDFRADYRLDLERFAATGTTRSSHSILPSFLFYLENEVRLLAGVRAIRRSGEPWRQELTLTLNYKAL